MLYQLTRFADWLYHKTPLNQYGLRWSWICDKWEEMNADVDHEAR